MRQLRPYQGLLARAFLCWLVGIFALIAIGTNKYDLRFLLRGSQPSYQDVAIVRVPQDSWNKRFLLGEMLNQPVGPELPGSMSYSEVSLTTALHMIIKHKPSTVGVLGQPSRDEQKKILNQLRSSKFWDRIVWGGQTNRQGWLALPLWLPEFHQNLAIDRLQANSDGYIREYKLYVNGYPHILTQLAHRHSEGRLLLTQSQQEMQKINFRGGDKTFKSYDINEIGRADFDSEKLSGKIVLLSIDREVPEAIVTPVGDLAKSEIYANILDNIMMKRHIKPIAVGLAVLILLVLAALSTYAMSIYPQALAFLSITWIGIIYSAISIWLFDQYNFWLPIAAPLVQLLVTYVVLLGYRLTIKDTLSWKLEQERKYLIQVEQMKENFVSLISHDLKTPLAKIQVICDRLLKKDNDKKITQDLLLLRRESLELHRYIQSILKVGQIESRNLELHKEAADLNEIILKAIDDIRSLAEAKNISLVTELEPLFLTELDIVLIKEVIMNLLDNAIKYTPDGGEVRVKTTEIDDNIVVEVSDTGRGIAAHELPKIFDKFYRGKDKKNSAKGSGLGLYLVKYFIEKHLGRIFVEQKSTGGTRIGFVLPVSIDTTSAHDQFGEGQETEENYGQKIHSLDSR